MSAEIGDKYKAVLNALIDQNYHVINDVYLDMFISHISGRSGEGMMASSFCPSITKSPNQKGKKSFFF